MARTRSDFEQSISGSLQGVTWSRLKNALLGSELLAFGAVFNEAVAAQYTTLLKNMAPEYADYLGLAVLGFNQYVAYDVLRPTIATINLPYNGVELENDVRPFKLTYTVGGEVYFTHEYVRKGTEQLTLYQGVLGYTCFVSSSTSPTGRTDEHQFYQSGTYWQNGMKYVKLPVNVLIDSLRVYLLTKDEDGNYKETPVQISYNPKDPLRVHVFRAVDNTLNVMFTDVDSYDEVEDVMCYYIVGGSSVPSSQDNDTIVGTLSYPREVVHEGDSDSVSLSNIECAIAEGSGDLDVARTSLVNHLSINSSISTKEQVRAYVNDFPIVWDSNPVRAGDGSVSVWLYPVKEEYRGVYAVNVIEEYLRIYGELAVLWNVAWGTPVSCDVTIVSYDSSLTSEELSEIQTEVQNYIAENIGFDTVVCAAWLMQAVPDYISRVGFSISVSQTVESSGVVSISLASSPIQGTLEFYRIVTDSDGNEVQSLLAWDSLGYVMGYFGTSALSQLSNADLVTRLPYMYIIWNDDDGLVVVSKQGDSYVESVVARGLITQVSASGNVSGLQALSVSDSGVATYTSVSADIFAVLQNDSYLVLVGGSDPYVSPASAASFCLYFIALDDKFGEGSMSLAKNNNQGVSVAYSMLVGMGTMPVVDDSSLRFEEGMLVVRADRSVYCLLYVKSSSLEGYWPCSVLSSASGSGVMSVLGSTVTWADDEGTSGIVSVCIFSFEDMVFVVRTTGDRTYLYYVDDTSGLNSLDSNVGVAYSGTGFDGVVQAVQGSGAVLYVRAKVGEGVYEYRKLGMSVTMNGSVPSSVSWVVDSVHRMDEGSVEKVFADGSFLWKRGDGLFVMCDADGNELFVQNSSMSSLAVGGSVDYTSGVVSFNSSLSDVVLKYDILELRATEDYFYPVVENVSF